MVDVDMIAIVDGLLDRPFPGTKQQDGGNSSGPAYHLHVLRESEDFWDDEDGDAAREAHDTISATRDELAAALTARWGEPTPVDLTPFLNANPAPVPFTQLSLLAVEMLLWRRPAQGRWFGLAVGQADKEFPIQLLAAVGRD